MRTLDLTALRALVAIADTGGVTRAANVLNLTQSAVSMQMKRVEQMLDTELLERRGRQVQLTPAGEQLLGYARRMLALNDEAVSRITAPTFEGELVLGVPHDIVFPHIPNVLKQFAVQFPRVNVRLVSTYTVDLKDRFENGECDVILTTERDAVDGAETLVSLPLTWVGAVNGNAWRRRPLRLAFETNCVFRPLATAALEEAQIPWDMVIESEKSRSVSAIVSADLAVHLDLGGDKSEYWEQIDHGGTLPEIGDVSINLYQKDPSAGVYPAPGVQEMADLIRTAYRSGHAHHAIQVAV